MEQLNTHGGQLDPTGYDLLVTGAKVVSGGGVRAADVAVRGGRIVAVLAQGTGGRAREVIRADGKYLLPGMIDSHVHFRTPGLVHKEDWEHGSRAAVAGGMTTVIDMPNTVPPLFGPADAHDKHELITGTSLVDYRFHAGVDPTAVHRLREFAPREATSAKAFLTGHHTAHHVLNSREGVEELFRVAADSGMKLLFHAEQDSVFSLLDAWLGAPKEYRDYEKHRPRSGGIVAVVNLIEMVRRHGTEAHVVHVSSREEADLLSAAAANGLPITFEVTAHHLSFTASDTDRLGARIRLSPAIRDEADQERLWSAVIEGEAVSVGSDHAPHLLPDKVLSPTDAPPGLPGVQELFPALITGLRRRRPDQDLGELLRITTRVLAEGPAAKFGLDTKGRIAPGQDADLVLFDPDTNWMLDESAIQARCGWSAYQGWTFTGAVERTIRRGRTVFERAGGHPTFGTPDGRWLMPDGAGAEEAVTSPSAEPLVGGGRR